MKTTFYCIWVAWAVLAILSEILLHTGWWVATSWIWLPLAVVLTAVVSLNASVDLGRWLKAKQEKEIPKTCDNCLFGLTAQYDTDKRCLGETLDESIKRPKVCKYHKMQGR